MEKVEQLRHYYLRHDKKFPHVWCPGCGNGIILGSLIRAIDKIGLSKDEVVLASGIGCAGRMPVYADFNTLHTTHGRALTFATGIKLARPELNLITVMGDGDATGIGGNHFIHAARRNLNLTAIIINNQIYGMTGGQYSPTTPYGAKAATATGGHLEHAFSIADLAVTAGASFVARGTVYHVPHLDKLIEQGIRKNGFAVIEIMAYCHTQFGRRNKMGDAVTMMEKLRDRAVAVKDPGAAGSPGTAVAAGASDTPGAAASAGALDSDSLDTLDGKFAIGVLTDVEKPDYIAEYARLRAASRLNAQNAGNAGK
ncbi:2-oxoacid:ferredoxin oxidoreductase subunit beta [Desulfurivibrio dismutans]|uniref:2-oxoacid:ferredoxin oxidoreductase subunit beta n=1 Tax=Desulfurivibrio dismutans TaxID=1398908 RepID=UPI003D65DAC0